MENKIRRPPPVWIAQGLLILFAFVLLSIPFVQVNSSLEETRYYSVPIALASTPIVKTFLISVGLVIPLLVILAIAFWGLLKRKYYARYLIIFLLITTWVFAVRQIILFVQGWLGYAAIAAYSRSSLASLFFSLVIIFSLLPLIASLILSQRVAIFFSTDIANSSKDLPPPPPSFDA